MVKTDAVIVGGGPAGCSAALTLATFGITSAVMCAPKAVIKPTETCLPTLVGLLRSLNAESALDACEPCYGISSEWGRPHSVLRPSIIDPFGHTWFIHRQRFDAALRDSVLKAGLLWLEGVANDVSFDEESVTVTTSGERVRAKWLIIATGSPAWAARNTGQPVIKHDSLTALWAKLPEVNKERFLFVEPSEFGWWYVVPDDGPGSVACFMTDPSLARNLRAAQASRWSDLFRKTNLARTFGNAATVNRVTAASTGLMALTKVRGERWIAIGDAALKLDPLGSGGAMTALNGGQRAARAVAECLKGSSSEIRHYEQWTTRLFNEFSRQRELQYGLEFVSRSSDFWKRRSSACISYSCATTVS
jgi:flavin-dependent dehydrogenase